jgi:hypothetical protein
VARSTRRDRCKSRTPYMRANQKYPLDSVVRVINKQHWLLDAVGVVRPPSREIERLKDHVAAKNRPIDIVVDFHECKEGWVKSTLFGVRKVVTHTCHGALSMSTGYIMQESDLELVEQPRKMII